jgi:hypothetical protein
VKRSANYGLQNYVVVPSFAFLKVDFRFAEERLSLFFRLFVGRVGVRLTPPVSPVLGL